VKKLVVPRVGGAHRNAAADRLADIVGLFGPVMAISEGGRPHSPATSFSLTMQDVMVAERSSSRSSRHHRLLTV
jgi:hypothetical protein